MSNEAVIRGVYEAFGRGDIPSILDTCDPAVEWNEAENVTYDEGRPWVGPDEVLNKLFLRIGAEWTGFTVDVRDVIAAGDKVVVVARYRARYNETGKDLDAQVVHIWTLRGGKIVRFDQYTDTLQFAEVTGQRMREIRRRPALA